MVEPELALRGTDFQPSRLVDAIGDIQLKIIENKGDIGKIGMHKGKPVPNGWCIVCVPSEIKPEKKIEWMADFLNEHTKLFEEMGVTDIDFHIYWYGIQGNMELSATELKKLSELEIPIAMTYIHEEA